MTSSEGEIEPVKWLFEMVCRAVPYPKRRQAELQGMTTSALRELLVVDSKEAALTELELQFLLDIAAERKTAADPEAEALFVLVETALATLAK